MSKLQIGFARECYSPDTPQPQNGECLGTTVLTDIYVTCVALSDGDETALIFSNDIRNFSAQFVEAFRKEVVEETGLDGDRVMISCTHNHSAPDNNYYQKREEVTDWVERICFPAVRRAAKSALADRSPVTRLTSGITDVENVAFVRRYFREDGILSSICSSTPFSRAPFARHETEADTELRALRFYREGKKDVVLTNFQVHAATGLNVHPDKICADFLHEFRKVTEESGEFLVCYLQGGCGNLNTYSKLYPDACNDDFDRAGRLIGEGVLRALENAEDRDFEGLVVKKEDYMGICNHTRDHLVVEARQARQKYRESGLDREHGQYIFTEAGFESDHECAQIISKSQLPKTRAVPLCTICFGDVGMTFAPFEMFDTNCKQIRDASPFAFTMTVGYTNFRHHYLPSAYGFSNKGYEALQCFFIPGTGETVALEFLRQLCDSKKELKKFRR